MPLGTRLPAGLEAIAAIGARDDDPPEVRIRKRVLAVSLAMSILFLAATASLMALSGRWDIAEIFSLYFVFSSVSLGLWAWTGKGYALVGFSQLALVLVVCLGTSLMQGGLAGSAGNWLWSIVVPMGALLLYGRRAAVVWFAFFVADIALCVALPAWFPHPVTLSSATAGLATAANFTLVSVFVLAMLSYFVGERERAQQLLEKERQRSEQLLLNVLPKDIAASLKQEFRPIAAQHDEASVLFADLAGFTPMSSGVAPLELVSMLGEIFSGFDALVEKYGLEKIKTIGDCYMVAAGVPVAREDHAVALAAFALEMRDQMKGRTFRGKPLTLRIGIHSGPVVAGVIGTAKFAYDLWGDTVNTASRMESHGVPGEIQVSEETRRRLGEAFELEARPAQEIKGKGRMEVFLVKGKRESAARVA